MWVHNLAAATRHAVGATHLRPATQPKPWKLVPCRKPQGYPVHVVRAAAGSGTAAEQVSGGPTTIGFLGESYAASGALASSPSPMSVSSADDTDTPEEPAPTPTPTLQPSADAPIIKVAAIDATRFVLHPSVDYWRTYSNQFAALPYGTGASASSIADSLTALVRDFAELAAVRDPQSAAFWAYHTARMTFFITQGLGILLTHHILQKLGLAPSSGAASDDGANGAPDKTPLERFSDAASRELYVRVREALDTFRQDYDNIRSGAYPLPWDMTTPGHRQYNPLFVLDRTALLMQEGAATLQRRVRNEPDPVWLRSRLYPQYYTKTFHYQTDGWFSDLSARVYEHSTETLFFGRQDAMQRTSLLPLASYVAAAAQQGRDVRQMRLLEVAAGTGRFHTFIKDAYPDLPSVVSDLSPYYLAQARDNINRWKQLRQPNRWLDSTDGTGAEYLQTAAEDIAAPDGTFDVVVCVYLFHELPEAIRRRAAAEFARVLKPGGLMVFTDSVQLGDRPEWDATVGQFGDFNEPYYRSYVQCDLGKMFEEAGFVCSTKYLSSATKTLSFFKPDTTPADAN